MGLLRLIFLFFCFCAFSEEPLLKESDIHEVMDQIFRRHVARNEVSLLLIKGSVKNYIEQADPDRTYFLSDEVSPYSNLSDQATLELMEQYQKRNYSAFFEMNKLIQKAYLRLRKIREENKNNYPQWVEEAAKAEKRYPDSWEDWPMNLSELERRSEEVFKAFVQAWIHRYGKARALSNPKEVMARFENEWRDKEDAYLYLTPEGKPLSEAEEMNFFSLHVLKAVAAALDSHTKVYNPKEAFEMRIRLEKGFEGIGLVFEKGEEGLRVARIVAKSPAAFSKMVQEGDLLIAVDNVDVRELDFEEAIEKVRGAGSEASFTFSRKTDEGKKLIQVPLKKGHIAVDVGRADTESRKFGNGIVGVIRLDSFYSGENGVTSEQDVKRAIETFDKQNLRGLILDLRENTGGFLIQAVKVVGLFISNGVVVISKYASGDEKIYRDLDQKALYQGPLVLLVSKMTASAAEIVAEALQDYGVALIVGDEHTYGKGTVQSQTVTDKQKSAASYFKVTVGKYYTVSGKTPQLQGVVSDIVVPGPLTFQQVGEAFLKGALPADTIEPSYEDTLADVNPYLRSWYLKYYLPTLQRRTSTWKSLTPELKQRSEYRIAHNRDYQQFLQEQKEAFEPRDDLQLDEAYHIVEDMIYLETKAAKEKQKAA